MDITRTAEKCNVLAGGERRKPKLETFTMTRNASESTSLTSVIFWRSHVSLSLETELKVYIQIIEMPNAKTKIIAGEAARQ
jgi:uncharacterized lipoprotein YbaY